MIAVAPIIIASLRRKVRWKADDIPNAEPQTKHVIFEYSLRTYDRNHQALLTAVNRKWSIQAVAPFIIAWPCPIVRWKAGNISFAEPQTKHVKFENSFRTCGRNCSKLMRFDTAPDISSCIRDRTKRTTPSVLECHSR
jgi:hypothetical protein